MATEVKIPALGESITSGIIAAWHVKDGDYVSKDQAIYELETDKITSEGLAETAGTISLQASEGDEVEIGQRIATIDETATAPTGNPAPANQKSEPAESPSNKPQWPTVAIPFPPYTKKTESGPTAEKLPSQEYSPANPA